MREQTNKFFFSDERLSPPAGVLLVYLYPLRK